MNIFQKLYYYSYSLLFCLRFLPFNQAIKIPILVSPNIKIGELKRGRIVLEGGIRHSKIVIGLPGTEGRASQKTMISIHENSHLRFKGKAVISEGSRIIIKKGEIVIGNHFICNSNCFFDCSNRIEIGNGNFIGWNVNFITKDGHSLYENNQKKIGEGDIKIGNHVWIASYCNISKNVEIADGCVVAQNSVVTKNFLQTNTLIGGIPAKEIKYNISWMG